MRINGRKVINSNSNRSEVMTIRDAAQYLRCHQSALYRLCNAGQIPAFRLGGGWRLLREVLEGWMLRGGTNVTGWAHDSEKRPRR
jgi:excisionase family DNA binding protein